MALELTAASEDACAPVRRHPDCSNQLEHESSGANWIVREHITCTNRSRSLQTQHTKGGVMPEKTSKRELVDTGKDKRFIRRDEKGRFDDVSDVGKSLAQDRRQDARKEVPPGQGDRGDQKRKH